MFLITFYSCLLNFLCRCLAEGSITEAALKFEVPSKVKGSTFKDHDYIVACYIYLPRTTAKGQRKFDATESKYKFDRNLCTHLVLSTITVASTLNINEDDSFNETKKFRPMKEMYPDLQIFIQVYLETGLVKLLSSSESRQIFIMHLKTTLRRLHLDGIVLRVPIFTYSISTFTTLAHELKELFKQNGLLIGAEISLHDKWNLKWLSNIGEISTGFDLIFVRTWHFNLRGNTMPLARYNAPIYSRERNEESIYDRLKILFTKFQISPRNLILIFPLFGYAVQLQNYSKTNEFPYGYNYKTDSQKIREVWKGNDDWSYRKICSKVLHEKNEWKMYWDDLAKVPFLKNKGLWITFENAKSIREKTKLIGSLNLRGVSIYAMDFDDLSGGCSNLTYPLLKTINYELNNTKTKWGSKYCIPFIDDLGADFFKEYKPVVFLRSYSLIVAKGDSAEITCTVEGIGSLELVWMKAVGQRNIQIYNGGNVEILTVDTKTPCNVQLLTSTLKIKRVTSNDNFFCRVSYASKTKFKESAIKIQIVEAMEPSKDMEHGLIPQSTPTLIVVWITAASIGTAICIGFFLIIILLLLKRNAREKTVLTKSEIDEFKTGKLNRKKGSHSEFKGDPVNEPYDDSWELSNNQCKIDKAKILDQGAFGIVYRGQVKEVNVAAKTTKPGVDKQHLKSLLSELKILIYLDHHPHLVNLVGAVTTELSTVTYYNAVTIAQQFNWSYQIAGGLYHLSLKKLIHGDLAARNVLLCDMNTIKIATFGISKKPYQYTTNAQNDQEPLPWRWMAIKSLREMNYSIQSDVWSFGVTIWEIFTFGETPYPELSWSFDFVDKLQQNMRLPKPKDAPYSL